MNHYVIDDIPRNTIADIPVSEIESIEVLKMRHLPPFMAAGANGVKLVTAEMATLNAPTQLSFNSYTGVNHPKIIKG